MSVVFRSQEPVPPKALAALPATLALEEAEDPGWARLVTVGAFVLLGLLLVVVGDLLGMRGSLAADGVWWAGLLTMFVPTASILLTQAVSRREGLAIVLVVGLALYVVSVLRSPVLFTGYDELLHYRTLDDMARTGLLFRENPLLAISPYYPGLEIVTHAFMSVTGLAAFQAGLIVIGVARVLLVGSLYLFLERVAVPRRLAALGTLLYVVSPSFLFFDSQFAYESLALPLAVFCLFLVRQAQQEEGRRRTALNALALLAALAVVVTHHVTSFILVGTLLAWMALALMAGRGRRDPLPGGGWVPLAALLGVILWLTGVAEATVGYIWPHVVSAYGESMRIISQRGGGRHLFESTTGSKASVLERVVGIGSVGLTLALIPLALRNVWQRQRRDALALLLVTATLAYPATVLLRFTTDGWGIASRATAFLYVALAFDVAVAIDLIRRSKRLRTPRLLSAVTVGLVCSMAIIFAGGIMASESPPDRLPRPYLAGAYELSVDQEAVSASQWASTVLGPDHRLVADAVNASLMGSYGRQRVVTGADHVSVSQLFLGEAFGDYERQMLSRGRIQFMLVDRRIVGVVPPAGYFFEPWEHTVVEYSTVTSHTVSRFDRMSNVSRVFDSGSIQLYDVRRLQQ